MSRVIDWLREAEEDLKSAEVLSKAGQFHHACFHAQQAAEKAVKAALRFFHVAKAGHAVTVLLEELRAYTTLPEELQDRARILDQYYIPPRYPNSFDVGAPSQYYTRASADHAIATAKEVVAYVTKIVS